MFTDVLLIPTVNEFDAVMMIFCFVMMIYCFHQLNSRTFLGRVNVSSWTKPRSQVPLSIPEEEEMEPGNEVD